MTPCRHALIVSFVGLWIAFPACDWAYPAVEGRFERTLSVSGPVDLEVLTGSGRIEVRAGSSSVVQVIGVIRARDDWRSSAQEKVRYLEANADSILAQIFPAIARPLIPNPKIPNPVNPKIPKSLSP